MQSDYVFRNLVLSIRRNDLTLSKMKTINFKIQGKHENHSGFANIVNDYNDGIKLVQKKGYWPNMEDVKTNLIGSCKGHNIYENYVDSGSCDYVYFAIKN